MWKDKWNNISDHSINIFDILLSFLIMLIIFSLAVGNFYTLVRKGWNSSEKLIGSVRAYYNDFGKKYDYYFFMRTKMLELNGEFNKLESKKFVPLRSQ